MTTYRLSLQPILQRLISLGEPISEHAMVQLIPGVIVHEVQTVALGHPATITVELHGSTHEDELNTLADAAQRLGYTVIDGEIKETVDAVAQSAIVSGLGAAGLGALTKRPEIALLVGAAGLLAGSWAASEFLNHEVIYHVRRVGPGYWQITPTQPQREPAFASLARRLTALPIA